MKKILLFVAAIMTSAVMMAQLNGKKIYVNPGHGSFGPNDRPMATIPYPNLATTGMPDTCGFYESNTNLWKCLELGRKLEAAGAVVMYSRTASGPWDYVYPYSDYTYDAYKAHPDYEKYNRTLSVIAAESETFGADMFISVHSNAATDGTSTNYPLLLYKGTDATADNVGSKEMCQAIWPYLFEMMDSELDPYSYYSKTKMNNRGCMDFYGYTLGVLKQSVPGLLTEGYFHTYQPARHRALNPDYCKQEGIRYYRGIAAYFGEPAETKGYIMGTVKDLHEKMSHKLFNYAAKTNDQWVPCNGAVVTLYKGGVEVAKYNVDTLYNGIFYFPDLEPGNDYTLDATCEGYKPLFDAYKEPITVKANETTYPMIYLESESYEPPKEVFVDYPDAAAVSEVAPSVITVGEATTATYAIEGAIKRTIQRGDSTIVLSHTEDKAAHLYLVNNKTGEISNISLEGIDPIDAENAGSYLALSDVALTCDGVLVGCNYIRCQYADAQVDAGYKRGAIQFYRWDSLHVAPVKWVSSQHSCNYNRGDMGMTIAVSGEAAECNVMVTGVTSSSARGMRVAQFSVVDNTIASTFYGKTAYSELALGEPFLLQLSPRDITKNYVIDGTLSLPSEFALAAASAQDVTPLTSLVADSVNLAGNASYLKYAGHSLMVMPYYTADTLVAGVRMYDVTGGLAAAKEIKLNATLATPVKATYAAAVITVSKGNFVIRLVTDATITTFTTAGVEQPVVANIYAYGLNVTKENDAYTFTFSANENAVSGDIIFYQNDEEVGRQALTDVVKGENTVTIKVSDLPGKENVATTWAIELRAENVTKWAKLYTEKAVSYVRAFNTVDNSPESDYFGQVYVINRAGSLGNAANGLHVYSQDYVLENTTPYYSGKLGNPQRAAVDEFGTIYLADWSDSHSGVYLVDPANISGGMSAFFQGTAASNGLITNNEVEVASGTPGVDIFGTGAETQLFVYCEDQGTTLPANSVYMYHIGNADGTLKSTWGEAPTKVYALKQVNGDGNIHCTSHGFFVSQNRASGSNNSGVPSLIFVDYEGNVLFNSGNAPYNEIIDGSARSGFTVSADESRLVLYNGSNQMLVFDIAWAENHTPTLTLAYVYEPGFTKNVCQMNFDYAGNLLVAGESGFNVFTIPTDNNVTVTPAKRSLVVGKGDNLGTNLENTELSAVVYSNNGTIFVEAEAGAMIEVYTVLGQRLFAAEATTNLTAIGNVPANIVLVRVNNQVVKVAVK
ncbi:MAG: N-acetylmuramoyl-L-alanine amidase [Paludibacteraceae bacterium]|nr:N-acetylmuramoyl-L-alanine amidase [Paludibacteraceae bacterium]